jgi:hypothetical protein
MLNRPLAAAVTAALILGLTATQADAARRFITFGGTCDVATVTSQPGLANVWTYDETLKIGSCATSIGVGTVGKSTLNGITARWISFGLGSPDSNGLQGNIAVQYPLVSGGAWVFYGTADGKVVSALSSGQYTVGKTAGPAKDAPDFRHAK